MFVLRAEVQCDVPEGSARFYIGLQSWGDLMGSIFLVSSIDEALMFKSKLQAEIWLEENESEIIYFSEKRIRILNNKVFLHEVHTTEIAEYSLCVSI